MQLTIDNRIRIPIDQLSPELLEALQREFTYENPQYAKLKAMGKRFIGKKVPKYISSWQIGGGELTLPRGGFGTVRKVVNSPLRIKRRMTLGDPALAGLIPDHLLKPRDYQVELRSYAEESGTALIRSPQGSGKTFVGYSIAASLKLPTLVVVPTEKIFNQWVKGVEKNLGMDPSEVGIIKGKKRIIRPLTIGMQQTLKNCASEYAETFGLVIGDEAQRFAANTFFDVIDVLKAAYRVGMSADERRADGKEFLVYDVFGPVGMNVSRETLIQQGAIIDAEIRVVPTAFEADWYKRLKPQRRMDTKVQEMLTNAIVENEQRNGLVMEVLGWCVAERQPTITLAWRRDHCAYLNSQAIARGWDSGLLLGGSDGSDEFDRTEREMSEGSLMQAVGTYQAVGVGFDLPRVSRGIFAAPCAGSSARQQFAQFCGRYERPEPETGKTNPNDSVVYYLWDKNVFGLTPLRNIARWKPKVAVLHEGAWVPAKRYIKEEVKREKEENEDDDQEWFKPAR